MTGTPIRFTVLLTIAVTTTAFAIGQTAPSSNSGSNSENVIQTLDQLIQQNQQLEIQNRQMEKQNQQLQKQNKELIEQIKALRGPVDQHVNVSEQATEHRSIQTSAAKAGQSSSQKQGTQPPTQD